MTGVSPSILLHPLDYLGGDDEKDLSFFPAMNLPGAKKMAIMDRVYATLKEQFEVVSMSEHAARASKNSSLKVNDPRFATA